MTEPREVTVSDEEVQAFRNAVLDTAYHRGPNPTPEENDRAIRAALAAFLAARVPDVPQEKDALDHEMIAERNAVIEFRDKVLKGV